MYLLLFLHRLLDVMPSLKKTKTSQRSPQVCVDGSWEYLLKRTLILIHVPGVITSFFLERDYFRSVSSISGLY